MAPCSNGVIKYNAVVVNSCDESIEFAVLIWPPPCIFNGHCDVGPLRMAPRLVLRTIGSRELQDGDFVRIVNTIYSTGGLPYWEIQRYVLLYCMILQSLESVKLGSFKTFALLWNSSCCWDFCQISVQLEKWTFGNVNYLNRQSSHGVPLFHFENYDYFFCRVGNNESLALLDVY